MKQNRDAKISLQHRDPADIDLLGEIADKNNLQCDRNRTKQRQGLSETELNRSKAISCQKHQTDKGKQGSDPGHDMRFFTEHEPEQDRTSGTYKAVKKADSLLLMVCKPTVWVP